MSTKEKETVVSTEVTGTTTASTTTSVHNEAAQQRVDEIHHMLTLIPHVTIPASTTEVWRLTTVASVPPECIELSAMAVANQKALVRGDAATPAEVRDLMQYADAYDPVADEFEAAAQYIRHSCTAARNRAGHEALTTYSLAKRLAKRPEHAALVAYVKDMRRALGRGRKVSPEVAAERAAAQAAKAAEKAAKAAAKVAALAEPKTTPEPKQS